MRRTGGIKTKTAAAAAALALSSVLLPSPPPAVVVVPLRPSSFFSPPLPAVVLASALSPSPIPSARTVPRGHRSSPRWTHLRASSDSTEGARSAPEPGTASRRRRRAVVVGGGWAGFSAASSLSSTSPPVDVVLLDASPRGRGGLAGGWRTRGGRPVEAGIHGFWREYRNTFDAMRGIDGLDLNDVLEPYTPSVLVSKRGRVALAPVLGPEDDDDEADGGQGPGRFSPFSPPPFPPSPDAVLESIAPLLPPPLDVALLSEFSPDSPLTALDRISAVGLLGAWADFAQEDRDSWDRYDGISAEDLFKKYAGVTDGVYDELVSPLLHVLPMCPGYDCSAAAALSCFHVFALQSRGAFDVRWCRGGIAEKIFDPWVKQLVGRGNVEIRGGARVTSIEGGDGGTFEVGLNDGGERIECDAVVLAVGGTAASRIAAGSSVLSGLPAARTFDRLRGVTCVAVRIFLEPHPIVTSGLSGGAHDKTQLPPMAAEAMRDTPVFVCGPGIGSIPELEETGFCVYDLQRMHDEFSVDRHGARDDDGGTEQTAVLEVDFFRADAIADMEDDMDVARLALRAAGSALGVKDLDGIDIVDVAVVRARDAVSHFALNSASYSPPVRAGDGIYMCGDWIDRSGHSSWSTEKAVVTGRQAAAAIAEDWGMECDAGVIPAAEDTATLRALRRVARAVRSAAPPPGGGIPPSPWAFARDVLTGGGVPKSL